MEKLWEILLVAVVVALIVFVSIYAVILIKDKSVFIKNDNPYCEASGYTLKEASLQLQTKLKTSVSEAQTFYLRSEKCFAVDALKMTLQEKKQLFCSWNLESAKTWKSKNC